MAVARVTSGAAARPKGPGHRGAVEGPGPHHCPGRCPTERLRNACHRPRLKSAHSRAKESIAGAGPRPRAVSARPPQHAVPPKPKNPFFFFGASASSFFFFRSATYASSPLASSPSPSGFSSSPIAADEPHLAQEPAAPADFVDGAARPARTDGTFGAVGARVVPTRRAGTGWAHTNSRRPRSRPNSGSKLLVGGK